MAASIDLIEVRIFAMIFEIHFLILYPILSRFCGRLHGLTIEAPITTAADDKF